jgi:hypothetical protein
MGLPLSLKKAFANFKQESNKGNGMVSNYKSLETFVAEVDRREKAKQDFLAPTTKLLMTENGKVLGLEGEGDYNINDHAHGQIADRLGIPRKYYSKMQTENPDLLMDNVNSWFRKTPTVNLVRTLDGNARAYLSDRFRTIDDSLIMQAFLPVAFDHKDMRFMTQALTDQRLYIQAVFPTMQAEVKKGDVIQAGIVLANSEVGLGAVDVSLMLWRLACTNGMTAASLLRKNHVGARIGLGEEASDIFARDTIEAEIKSFQLRLRDVLRNALTEASFMVEINKMREAAGMEIDRPTEFIKNVTKSFGFSEKDSDFILSNMVAEHNLNKYGFANGITNLARQLDNRDRQYDLESVGYKALTLPASEWKALVA